MNEVTTERRGRRTVLRVGRVAATIALVLASFACLAVAFGYATGAWRVQPVPTGSMAPAIHAGSAIVARPVPVGQVDVGDIIVFKAPLGDHRLIAHRVNRIEKQNGSRLFITKGDANEQADPWQARLNGQHVYRVHYVIPHAGTAVSWLRSVWVRTLTILFGGALILITGLRAIWGERKPEKGESGPAADSSRSGASPSEGRSGRARAAAAAVPMGAIFVVVAIMAGSLAYGTFTTSRSASATYQTGILNAPSPLACSWTSTTTLTFNWLNTSPLFATGYDLQRSTTSGSGYTTQSSYTPATTITGTNAPSPVTSVWYYIVRSVRSPTSWISANSNETRSDQCVAAINAFAGDGTAGFGGDGGAAVSAQLNAPRGIAFDSSGNAYIADTSNNRVRKVDTAGNISTIAGDGGTVDTCATTGVATTIGLSAPRGIAVDSSGNVYVADNGNNANNRCIRRIDTSGNLTRVAGGGSAVPACNATGSATTLLRIGANPSGLAVDSAGNVYLADTGSNCIRRISGGNFFFVAGGGATTTCNWTDAATMVSLSAPNGVAVNSAGTTVYIADTTNNCVRSVNGGNYAHVAGGGVTQTCTSTGPATAVFLQTPKGVAVDAAGRVFVTSDNGTNRCVRKVVSGTYSQVAFAGALGFTGDNGPAVAALISQASWVALDPSGNLYVSDRSLGVGGSRVRKIIGPIP